MSFTGVSGSPDLRVGASVLVTEVARERELRLGASIIEMPSSRALLTKEWARYAMSELDGIEGLLRMEEGSGVIIR